MFTSYGAKQYVWIRGTDINNPVLFLLHGGPGSPLMLFHRDYFAALEKYYTLVHWD